MTQPNRWYARAGVVLATVLLIVCCLLSLRFAYGDAWAATRTIPGLRTAIEVVPWNADYHRLLGVALEWEGDEARSAFAEGARLNPRAASVLIRLAQSAEREGNATQAEAYLVKAATVDQTFDPRWALANFYFRHERFDRFWYWLRLSLDRVYGDGRALFELCSQVPNGDVRLHAVIRGDADSLSRYLSYLLGGSDVRWIGETSFQLAGVGRASDRALLLAACDRLIAANRGREAQVLWDVLTKSGVIAVPNNPDNLVKNTNFSAPPLDAGFDWRRGNCPGVSTGATAEPAGLKLELEGPFPDRCELLSQYIVIPDGASMAFHSEVRAEPEDDRPFVWSVCTSVNCQPMEGVRRSRLGDGWTGIDSHVEPPEGGLMRLVVTYERPVGSTRYQGELRLRNIGLVRQ